MIPEVINLPTRIRAMLADHPEMTPGAIATRLGCSPATVYRARVGITHGGAQRLTAAARIGISLEEYEAHRSAGERWCCRGRHWTDSDNFAPEQTHCRAATCVQRSTGTDTKGDTHVSDDRGIDNPKETGRV